MFSNLTTRRGFAAKLAALLPGLGLAGAAAASPVAPGEQAPGGVQKLNGDGKPSDGKGFITPLIIHNGLIYIAGQGAHSRGDKSDAGKTPTIEMHTKMVMDGVKGTVEAGGGTLDNIPQLTHLFPNTHKYIHHKSGFKNDFSKRIFCLGVTVLFAKNRVLHLV